MNAASAATPTGVEILRGDAYRRCRPDGRNRRL